MTKKNCTPKRGKVIEIDEGQVKAHVEEVVRGSVEEALNTLLREEADRLSNAGRYERTDGRRDTGPAIISGSYRRPPGR